MEAVKKTLKDSAAMRWLVMLLISGLTFSTYYFQDFYSGLKALIETDFGFTSEEFGRMLGLTTIANVFGMIIIGGIVIDKWGIRLAGIVFGGLATLGGLVSALTAAGYFGDDKSTLLTGLIIGRIMFGSGLEVVCVVAMRTIVKWFKGHELALAMGINMGFGRLGSALAIAISLDIAGVKVSPAVTFAASLIGLSLIMFLIYTIFDVRLDKQLKKADIENEVEEVEEEDFKFSDLLKLVKNNSFVYITLLCVAFYSAVFPFIQYAPDLLVNKFGFSYDLPEGASIVAFGSEAFGNAMVYITVFIFAIGITVVPNNIKSKQLKVGLRLVLILVFAFLVYRNNEMISLWLMNGPKTSALIPLGTIIFTPIFGTIVDNRGKAASLMMLGAFLLIFAHVSLALFDSIFFAYAGLVSLGIAFSLVPAAMWPSVAKIVPERRLGTAYASMFTVQNWGLGLFFWGIGALLTVVNTSVVDRIKNVRESLESQGLTAGEISDRVKEMQMSGELPYYDYTIPILVLVLCGVVSIYLAYMLKRADKKQGYGLELPSGAESPRDKEAREEANK